MTLLSSQIQQEARREQLFAQLDRRFVAMDIAEFLTKEYPARECILSPWLPTQGLAMIYAKRGVGKTQVALEIAHAVASGGSIFEWSSPKPRGVLFIDGEMPAVVTQQRLAAIAAAADKEPVAPLLVMPVDDQPHGVIDLSSVEDQELLEPLLDGIELIIVDNISTCCRTGRENEAEGWMAVQDWALRQRARGRTVLFLHHAGKGGTQRGTSKREDVLDSVLVLKHPPDYDPQSGARFEVHYEKARGFHGDDVKPFEANLRENAAGEREWVTKFLEESTFDKVISLANEGRNGNEIAEILNINKSTVSRHRDRAKSEGLIDG